MKRDYKNGDIFITTTGGQGFGDSYKAFYSIWEYQESEGPGHGRVYMYNGDATFVAWRYPDANDTVKVENITEDILYSFKHGEYEFTIMDSIAKECKSAIDIIKSSNFKILSLRLNDGGDSVDFGAKRLIPYFWEDPDFGSENKLHDWRSYVTDEMRKNWDSFSRYQKRIIATNFATLARM